eukprot:TRINITY_DN14227_c0_g1_i1.p1 TRINITY_DN14227_c0_g1~~TRINITY_DN14227_c0_g1_i1.p1  ORF type:complete len:389 (+),score=73.40 TRINITY_DN14227_c0_g1_i1:70-1167(+)
MEDNLIYKTKKAASHICTSACPSLETEPLRVLEFTTQYSIECCQICMETDVVIVLLGVLRAHDQRAQTKTVQLIANLFSNLLRHPSLSDVFYYKVPQSLNTLLTFLPKNIDAPELFCSYLKLIYDLFRSHPHRVSDLQEQTYKSNQFDTSNNTNNSNLFLGSTPLKSGNNTLSSTETISFNLFKKRVAAFLEHFQGKKKQLEKVSNSSSVAMLEPVSRTIRLLKSLLNLFGSSSLQTPQKMTPHKTPQKTPQHTPRNISKHPHQSQGKMPIPISPIKPLNLTSSPQHQPVKNQPSPKGNPQHVDPSMVRPIQPLPPRVKTGLEKQSWSASPKPQLHTPSRPPFCRPQPEVKRSLFSTSTSEQFLW